MNESTETPIDEAGSVSTGLAVELTLQEYAFLLDLVGPRVVQPEGAESYIVALVVKLSKAFGQLKSQCEGEASMPAGGESYDKGAHVPSRASGDMTKQAGGHAEPATKKYLKIKSVSQVMGEAPHLPMPRDTEKAIK